MQAAAPEMNRLKLVIRGAVQGVGFRPFVFRLAGEIGLAGWVNNSAQGVSIEVEGPQGKLEEFLRRLPTDKPQRSFIQSLESSWLDTVGYLGFEIRESQGGGDKTALVMPDIATCDECRAEIFDPQNRRYHYPFTNCTNCGPRFSIIEALPYDRVNTSMKQFTMCPQCQAEYDDPANRRFHAQPNACPVCGPQLQLWDPKGELLAGAGGPTAPLIQAVEAIRAGQIVAVKGLGGFHVVAAAASTDAVTKLRVRKDREEKPFALMFPSLAAVREVCHVDAMEERLLRSPESPIVLLHRLPAMSNGVIAPGVAPDNPNLGVMLPYTPLHHLLLAQLQVPIVATSGNLKDEPICIDEREAVHRLKGIADLFLVHNRAIVRHVDDSIVRLMAGRELVLRRARGYAPLPVQSAECRVQNAVQLRSAERRVQNVASPSGADKQEAKLTAEPSSELRTLHSALCTVLGVGGHLKNAVALGVGPQVFISQHIGDLETIQAFDAFQRVSAELQKLFDAPANQVASDAHPDYLSTRFAMASGLPCVSVQHHLAHVLSCMAENDLTPPVLGVAWDGTGYGSDGTVWGGEFFEIRSDGYKRVAHLRQFPLPGGEQAVKEPRRSALGLVFAMLADDAFNRADLATVKAFSSKELAGLRTMLSRNINSPVTSSAGRLFDAVASLIGVRQRSTYEGQAAMELEFLASEAEPGAYDLALRESDLAVLDWATCIKGLLADLQQGVAPSLISARFHNALVEAVIKVARQQALERVVLSGGCFQNRYLTERLIQRLRDEGFRPYWHQRVPPNDGGICLGQVVAARWWNV